MIIPRTEIQQPIVIQRLTREPEGETALFLARSGLFLFMIAILALEITSIKFTIGLNILISLDLVHQAVRAHPLPHPQGMPDLT
jgi:hypothetical protein